MGTVLSQSQVNILAAIVFFAVGLGLGSSIAWVIHKRVVENVQWLSDVVITNRDVDRTRYEEILARNDKVRMGLQKVWQEMHNEVPSQGEQIMTAIQALSAISKLDKNDLTAEMKARSARAIASSALKEIEG